MIYNKVEQLPDSITHTLRLKVINVSNNRLQELPETLGSQQLLEEIDCSNNELTELPKELQNHATDKVITKLTGKESI